MPSFRAETTLDPVITSPRRSPQRVLVTAYDFEWTRESPHQITLCGAYDDRGYRWYMRCRDFLRGELTPKNHGRCFYAHFGGASDMVFLLKELIKDRRCKVRGVFSGSSAIMVVVERGGYQWRFIDSFWLMRTKLANIGKFMGLPKLAIDFDAASFAELRTYNERDCKLLYEAVCLFQEQILSVGGELGVTAASTAMKTFLRAYLQRPLRNSEEDDDYVRPSYIASRVEVIRPECGAALAYDINSSFPYSMTFPCPGQCIGHRRQLNDTGLWFAEVDLRTPDDNYLPTIPYRSSDGRIFYPTGSFRARISSEDYKAGGFEILKLHNVRHYEERDDLAQFAEDFYRRRKNAEPGSFESEVFKILLNSVYGKFAERDEKKTLLVRPDRVDPSWEAIAEHCYLVDEQVRIPHSHVPFSAMITSRSRRLLLEHARFAAKHGHLFYCDTDSVYTDAQLPVGTGLGALKVERTIQRGRFVGAKLYAVEEDDERALVKAKGFSSIVSEGGDRQPLTYAQFTQLVEGRSVLIERMLRLRELLRKEGADYVPRTERQEKQLGRKQGAARVMPMPKRCFVGNNDTRPWNIRELQ